MKLAGKRNIAIVLTAMLLFYSCRDNSDSRSETKSDRESFPQSNTASIAAGNNESFVKAARSVTAGVVHVKTVYESNERGIGIFGGRLRQLNQPQMRGSGSGVVISADGFIATNNHVVENAQGIEVVFPNRRAYKARLVGRDPNTDLALLKVDEKDLSFVTLGNSDNAQIGEWVLAVGYPYSLNTTVTAGIISAKGRSIGIINQSRSSSFSEGVQANTAIESFIQTDAAINPGNSGGALVNMNGELIGINTAIASLTGSYAGYAFAVPVNLARKILDDLRKYGEVKRGLLGVMFPSPAVEDQYFRQQGIDPGKVKGIYITGVQPGSAADEAGLKEGDIIQSVDGVELFSSAEFSERIARMRPGDKLKLDYLRNGKTRSVEATLKAESRKQKKALADQESLRAIYEKLGARFEALSPEMKEHLRLESGVIVTEVVAGGFFDRLGIPPGTIITFINGKSVSTPQDIDEILMDAQNGRVQILGIAPDGSRIAFNFSLGA